MRYIDSGSRAAEQTLGAWLQAVLTEDVEELRSQSGFFTAEPLGLFLTTLDRLRVDDKPTRLVLGSNDPGTLGSDVRVLADLMGLPRENGELGIISYDEGYFHPKTYHLKRSDGSQAAYVGSANLTGFGASGLHIEAGLTLDSRDGDPIETLDQIAAAVDAWFSVDPRGGFNRITVPEDVDLLVTSGALVATRPPRQPRERASGVEGEGGTTGTARPRLRRLITLPALPAPAPAGLPPVPAPMPPVPVPPAPVNVSTTRTDFPAYLLFAPNATAPTVGANALTGTSLAGGAVGLVIRLNRDSARHFDDRSGTANVSIPVVTTSTLRFGIFQGKYQRPRTEFGLLMRYVGNGPALSIDPAETNVMAYGFAPGESGHGDVRLAIPAAVRALRDAIRHQGSPVPAEGDFALLEWPATTDLNFRLTFLDQSSPVGQQAQQLFANAMVSQQTVGGDACWLPPGVSPAW